jgi:hypothetical protein
MTSRCYGAGKGHGSHPPQNRSMRGVVPQGGLQIVVFITIIIITTITII